MEFFKRSDITDFVREKDKVWIHDKAESAFLKKEEYLPQCIDENSPGGAGDYSSYGDYWWPDPDQSDGLPYIRRDGETNPDNFAYHRRILREFRTTVSHLTAGYLLYSKDEWAESAVKRLERFFVNPDTRMNPNLLYAQALPGICVGRGIGIIDTLHLIEVPIAAELLERAGVLPNNLADELKNWFSEYLKWMTTHPQGIDEMNTDNNHTVCWTLQVAVFALYTGNNEIFEECRKRFMKVILPGQMALDGGFPRELGRTKPYGYSLFQLDNICHLCYVLSNEEHNLWEFTLDDKRSVRLGLEYLFPYMADKKSWPLPPDVQHFEPWPVRQPSLLFGAMAYGEDKYLDLWSKLDRDPQDNEVRRNIAIRQPLLWMLL